MSGKEIKNQESQVSNRTLTIPNVLSFFRIILITPFVVFFLGGHYYLAAITILLSGLTDCFDGMIARKLHQESELGKILDPLADKLTLLAVGLCLIFIEPFVLPLMVILVVKDLLMLIGGSALIRRGIIPPKSKWYGKLGTMLFYITVFSIVFMKMIDHEIFALSIVMLSITSVVMIFALVKYIIIFFSLIKEYNSSKDKNLHMTAQVTKDNSSK